ncbi:hypothetical protein [Candidatus Nitrosocosmicus sp. SS]|uniref:hypothetical protein n=1 Tax=Candidatus Nitrosocosmicus agrestis TaxID=2563600 RepID=UPI00125B2895|nr:hypothetical protein [Candidatus Nitrosocosmicus sp. SS]KAA2282658.1 hypothetical protein F1Z66_04970 [Candidatus Nitrosocosmicus sp. SS]
MNRLVLIIMFWILGFVGGILVYSILPFITNFFSTIIPNLFSKYFLEALLAGIIGSGLSTIAVLYWANKSSKEF